VFESPEQAHRALAEVGYLTDRVTATTVYLADKLHKPLLLEGPAGSGKTEFAYAVTRAANVSIERLQCFEGITSEHAIGKFDESLQRLYLELATRSERPDWKALAREITALDFFIPGPLLQALLSKQSCVLLIDELDKVDHAFEPVAAVVVGAPTLFLAEHSEHDPGLVIVKPITDQPVASNLLISTRSGQQVSLRLVSDGETANTGPVDFVLIYKRPRDFLIPSGDPADAITPDSSTRSTPLSVLEAAFEDQQRVASPAWTSPHDQKETLKIEASIGSVSVDGNTMVVAFSVLNHSDQWVEVLPPQIELNNPAAQPDKPKAKKKKQKNILADQVPITEYRYTQRKLAPRARADGVVRFERPEFKQIEERLQLELATADAVNHPLLLNLPFTAPAGAPQRAATRCQEDTDDPQQ